MAPRRQAAQVGGVAGRGLHACSFPACPPLPSRAGWLGELEACTWTLSTHPTAPTAPVGLGRLANNWLAYSSLV